MSMERVAKRLRELESKNGRLAEADVVADARAAASTLHAYFEWNDTKAAEAHRLAQARLLIRRVKIEVTVRDVPLSVVRYVRDPEAAGEGGGYRNIVSVRSEENLARAAVIDEMNRVSKAARRARAVAAVLGLAEDVGRISAIAQSVVDAASADPASMAVGGEA